MSKDSFLKKFEEYVTVNNLIKSGSKILVGFSGGADSTALMLALLHIKQSFKLTLMAAHINYHLRGEDSIEDEKFVKNFCFNKNVNLLIHDKQIQGDSNIEAKAREIRMNYFDLIKKHYKIDFIALAHHRDDQAETVLSRFLRGSAFSGLKGISAKSGNIIHPMLSFTKEEIVSFLESVEQKWQEDYTNKLTDYSRNKIRNSLIPLLEKEFNPSIKNKLCDYAELFFESDKFFREFGLKLYKKSLLYGDETELIFSLDEILGQSPIVQFYIIRYAYERLLGYEKDFYQANFKELQATFSMNGCKEVHFPHGIVVWKDYDYLRFVNTKTYKSEIQYKSREITSLRSIFVFNGKRIIMQKLRQVPEEGYSKESDSVIMDLDQIHFPITVRYREDGDKFIPLGMHSFKKIKDFFIDEKLPKFQRDRVVIFSDQEKIFWISGYRLDQRVSVTDQTRNFVMFSIEDTKEIKTRSAKKKVKKG